jgi:serine/threonine protein kinase
MNSVSEPSVWKSWRVPTITQLQDLFEGYDILEIIGQGGMGVVYKARQKSLGRFVAIKILRPPEDAEDSFATKERFENEARTMAIMDHPYIVTVHNFGRTKDAQYFYFVMEYVEGTDLAKVINKQQRLDQDVALSFIRGVCTALGYAHDHGIIHRDVKPANILIDTNDQVRVADFGLARIVDPSNTLERGLTGSRVALGTPDFVAPELLTLETPDARADIYSVGVMLYQMLTGDVPRGLFKMPSDRYSELDPRVDSIICRAMEPEPNDRYQSTQEITSAIDDIRTSPQPEMPKKRIPLWGLATLVVGLASVVALYLLRPTSLDGDPLILSTNNFNASVIEINNLAVNRGNIAAQGALNYFGDRYEEGYYLAKAADGKVSGGIPGRATFEESVHTIFTGFGPSGEEPISNATNEITVGFTPTVNLVELAAYVSSADRNGPEDSDRAVTSVGFWIDTGAGPELIGNVPALDTDDVGGFDRISLSGEWNNVSVVIFTFTPVDTEIWKLNETRVAEIIVIEKSQ